MPEEIPPNFCLPSGEVHIWYGDPAELAADAMVGACRRLLSPGELTSCARFKNEPSKQLYLAAHALLRRVCSHYAAIVPERWQFRAGPYGKPELVGPLPEASFQFNLSHTSGLVACALSRDCEVGIDVESIERLIELMGLAQRFFSAEEAAALTNFPAAGRQQRFYQYWTLKEAYIKAIGTGLSMPLESFTMCLAAKESRLQFEPHQPLPAATIRFADGLSGEAPLASDPGAWQFAQYFPTASHVLAVAIHRKERPEQQIVIHRATPEFITSGHWSEQAAPE